MWKKNADLIVLGAMALLFASKFYFFQFYVGTALQQVMMVGLAWVQGYALGWLCSPRARAFRKFMMIAGFTLLVLVAIGDRGKLGWSLTTLIALGCFLIAFSSWFRGAFDHFFDRPTTFGSAEWASLRYIQKHGLIGLDGIRLGGFPCEDGLAPLAYTGDRHLLTVAPTRSNKGTSAIIPNLLLYKGSAVVVDPKGENAMITRAQRARMGQEIHVVDPWGITDGKVQPSRFNPLDWLRLDDPDIAENAMILADALVIPSVNEPFWSDEVRALFQGVILFVATDEDEAQDRHLGRVRDLLLLDGLDLKSLFMRMAASPHHVVASTGRRSLQKEERLLSNVLSSAQAQTNFLDSHRVRESLSASDFSFEDLKLREMTVYLVLPADRLKTFDRWLRLVIQQAITVNARNIELQPEHPILFLLDEMPALGRLTMVEQAFGLMAGFGIQLWGIAQDLSQLKSIYGDGYEGMIANSGMIQYFGSRDRLTAEYFSALCGVTTVWNLSHAIARTFGSSSGKDGTSTSSSMSNTQNYAFAQRKLAFPDELMRLPSGKQLIFVENHHPIMGTKVRWFEDPGLKTLGRNLRAEQEVRERVDG
ncbi:MAG: type IV secretory system conjugative DNA transfer family protein [Pseudomonadota bacterium]|uniref:type IV secretory system conjugative DNA transfer family protein n=1 Tax=Sphingobium xenophagum TaxID=121428 RepID=UPI001C0C8A03|nr:type IV secretory system conjugative DNA transfer family protein [Sphingobium xenophagum]QWT14773.1 type IV secretory system conjugative DNA transfer family protein [Sphingobium xenophagum]